MTAYYHSTLCLYLASLPTYSHKLVRYRTSHLHLRRHNILSHCTTNYNERASKWWKPEDMISQLDTDRRTDRSAPQVPPHFSTVQTAPVPLQRIQISEKWTEKCSGVVTLVQSLSLLMHRIELYLKK